MDDIRTLSYIDRSTAIDLVNRIKNGDKSAEHELVKIYQPRIEFILRRKCRDKSMVADLTQDTFIIAIQKLRSGELRKACSLAGYLQQIANNVATHEARTYIRRNTHPDLEAIYQQATREPCLSQQLERDELSKLVRQLIGELKIERDREMLCRYYLTEEPKSDICKRLNISHVHFDRVLYRARKRFRELVDKHLDKDFRDT